MELFCFRFLSNKDLNGHLFLIIWSGKSVMSAAVARGHGGDVGGIIGVTLPSTILVSGSGLMKYNKICFELGTNYHRLGAIIFVGYGLEPSGHLGGDACRMSFTNATRWLDLLVYRK
ncbi:hypothetical protein L6452_06546 [Arctium lappa]|uniref:Uncharacterized protein n=1 Tax=Arctium lappa TaxID=4217 RepID=A0ACB9EK63_ARCLA|nr:hypothetical protein L6452_06546 [Arctium lappa]